MAYFLRKIQNSRVNNLRVLWIKGAKFSGYNFHINPNIYRNFWICTNVPLSFTSCQCPDLSYIYTDSLALKQKRKENQNKNNHSLSFLNPLSSLNFTFYRNRNFYFKTMNNVNSYSLIIAWSIAWKHWHWMFHVIYDLIM